MNLGEVRGFVEVGLGRTDISPTMLNSFIDTAKRDMDRLVNRPNPRRALKTLAIGDYLVTLGTDIRAVHHSWVLSSELQNGRAKLLRKEYDELRIKYPAPTDVAARGIPKWWTYSYYGSVQRNMYIDSADYPVDYASFLAQDPSRVFAIEIGPSTDRVVTLELMCNGYTAVLEGDDDTNWWSENHGMTLVNMTMARMEWFFRNHASGHDFFKTVQSDLSEIYKDYIEADISDMPSEMRG